MVGTSNLGSWNGHWFQTNPSIFIPESTLVLQGRSWREREVFCRLSRWVLYTKIQLLFTLMLYMSGAQSIATSNSQHSLAVSNMLFYRFSITPHSNDCSINLDLGDRLKSPTSGGLLETQASIQCFADPNTTIFNDHTSKVLASNLSQFPTRNFVSNPKKHR